jgi:hypothetical protein
MTTSARSASSAPLADVWAIQPAYMEAWMSTATLLTRARIDQSQQTIERSLHLLQAAATHVRPPEGDPGRRAAALGPSLARAAMRRRLSGMSDTKSRSRAGSRHMH